MHCIALYQCLKSKKTVPAAYVYSIYSLILTRMLFTSYSNLFHMLSGIFSLNFAICFVLILAICNSRFFSPFECKNQLNNFFISCMRECVYIYVLLERYENHFHENILIEPIQQIFWLFSTDFNNMKKKKIRLSIISFSLSLNVESIVRYSQRLSHVYIARIFFLFAYLTNFLQPLGGILYFLWFTNTNSNSNL